MKRRIKQGLWIAMILGTIVFYGDFAMIPFSKPINVNAPIWPNQLNTFSESFYGIRYAFFPERLVRLPQEHKVSDGDFIVYVDDRKVSSLTVPMDKPENGRISLTQAHKVYIKNPNKEPLGMETVANQWVLGYQEAKDKYGNWVRIEEYTGKFIFCGNSIHISTLEQSDMIITKIPVYDGNFATELRLVTNVGISNTYAGRINEEQLIYEEED